MRISASLSDGSALMRLISAAPRGVTANDRSSATRFGLRFMIAWSAVSASASLNVTSSPSIAPARSFRLGSSSAEATITVQGSVTAHQLITEAPTCDTIPAAMSHPPELPPYRDVTVGGLLTRLARALPDHEALVYAGGPRFTFAELEQEARTIARGLMALGVAPGERVVLWATNVPEWIVLQFAVAKAGAILVTANTSLRARDVDYLLRQSEAATLITIRGFRDVDYVNELTAIGATSGTIPGLERLIFLSRRSAERAKADIGEHTPPGFTPYEQLREAAARVSEAELDARSATIG